MLIHPRIRLSLSAAEIATGSGYCLYVRATSHCSCDQINDPTSAAHRRSCVHFTAHAICYHLEVSALDRPLTHHHLKHRRSSPSDMMCVFLFCLALAATPVVASVPPSRSTARPSAAAPWNVNLIPQCAIHFRPSSLCSSIPLVPCPPHAKVTSPGISGSVEYWTPPLPGSFLSLLYPVRRTAIPSITHINTSHLLIRQTLTCIHSATTLTTRIQPEPGHLPFEVVEVQGSRAHRAINLGLGRLRSLH